MKKQQKNKKIKKQFQNLIAEYKEDLIEVLDGTSLAKMAAKKDKEKYEQFKAGTYKSDKESDYRDIYILALLEGMGFPMDKLGTYLYKELIMEVKEQLKEKEETIESYNKMYDDVNDFDSNLYLWIASDYLEMGIKTFMLYMKQAFDSIDTRKIKKAISDNLFAGETKPDYAYQTVQLGRQALIFDSHTKESEKVMSYMK